MVAPAGGRKRIPMFHPFISDSSIERVVAVLRSRWVGQGDLVDEFERAFGQRTGLPHVVAVNCSSSALRLALSIVGVKPGDEVLTTPMTCTLTNHPILEQFAVPVFADIQVDTGNLDPADLERRITDRTRAVVCTHWGGTPCDVAEINRIAATRGLPVIEDASEAIGATYGGRPIGSHSRFTAFSFQAVQILTMGEGGALAAQSPEDAEQARVQRWYGIDRKGRKPDGRGYFDFDITAMGFGYHLTNVAAAIGLGNLAHLDEALCVRRRIAERFRQELKDVPGLRVPREPRNRQSSNHFFTVHAERRDDFSRKLKERGIDVSIVHSRNDVYSVFGGMRSDLPNLATFDRTYIGLPCHTFLSDEDVGHIVATIREGW